MVKIPHVGDVFVIEESQKLENLIKMPDKELDKRKKEYSKYRGNYAEYCKITGKKDPFIFIALNNFENFQESYPKISDI